MKKIIFVALTICALIISACTSSNKLEIAIGVAAKECPFTVDEYTTCVDIFSEGTNVVYKYVVDEDEFTVADLNNSEGRATLKNEIYLNILANDNKDVEDFYNLVKEAKYNIIFRFIGGSTGESIDITIYHHEL